jgi:hypothetical protein
MQRLPPKICRADGLYLRYNEQIREIQTNSKSSKYALHILDTTHNYDTMEKTMKILHVERKGQVLDALENYYIYIL